MADFSGSYDTRETDQYTEITVDSGSSLQIFVQDGEDFENYWIDMSASGASCEILTYYSNSDPHGDWSIRNVAMVGEHGGDGWFIACAVADGSTGVIENVHIADGQTGYPHDGNPDWHEGGISYMARGHEGHLIARNVYFRHGVDNGFYWSNSTTGQVTIENCYAGPCHISCYRVCGDVTIKNSYADARITTGRGIWSWDGTDADVENSHIHGGSGGTGPGSGTAIVAGSGSVVNLYDSQYSNRGGGGTINENGSTGNSPQEFMPDGCPDSPEAVFDGTGGSGDPPSNEPEPDPPEEDYEVIEATGQNINISDGETFENKLIDMSGGGDISLRATDNSNWTIRNIGVKGQMQDGSSTTSLIQCAETDPNGTSTIENVYYADGAIQSEQLGFKFCYINRNHEGHIDIKNCNWQNVTSTAGYFEPGGSLGSGTVHVDNCYAANNGIDSVRVAGDGDKITNSVFEHKDDGAEFGRLIRTTGGHVDIENVHCMSRGHSYALRVGSDASAYVEDFHYDGSGPNTGDGTGVYVTGSYDEGTNVTNNPEPYIPDGCPTSAEEAASGGSGGDYDPGEPDENWVIEDPDSGDPVISYPDGTPQEGLDVHSAGVSYPSLTNMAFSDVYLADIDGIAMRVGSNSDGAEVVLENIHVDGAEVGIVAEGCPVRVVDSEINADTPRAVVGDGEIISENTNWGEDASPSKEDTIPASAEEAAGLSSDSSNP